MVGAIADITWELTGSELVALLLESYHIKQQIPVYNRAQRRKGSSYGLFVEADAGGYLNLKISNKAEMSTPIATFTSQTMARKVLNDLIDQHGLCQKLCGLYSTAGGCFHSQIGLCKGACKGEESPEEYNQRVEKAMASSDLPKASFFLLDKGRTPEELAVVKVECGKLVGWGFCDQNMTTSVDALHDSIKSFPDNRDSRTIIKSFLAAPGIKKIPF